MESPPKSAEITPKRSLNPNRLLVLRFGQNMSVFVRLEGSEHDRPKGTLGKRDVNPNGTIYTNKPARGSLQSTLHLTRAAARNLAAAFPSHASAMCNYRQDKQQGERVTGIVSRRKTREPGDSPVPTALKSASVETSNGARAALISVFQRLPQRVNAWDGWVTAACSYATRLTTRMFASFLPNGGGMLDDGQSPGVLKRVNRTNWRAWQCSGWGDCGT